MRQRQFEICGLFFGSDLVLGNQEGCGWVVLAIEMDILDGVLLLHPIVQRNDLKTSNMFSAITYKRVKG